MKQEYACTGKPLSLYLARAVASLRQDEELPRLDFRAFFFLKNR